MVIPRSVLLSGHLLRFFILYDTELSTTRDYLMLFCDKKTKQYMQPVTRQ